MGRNRVRVELIIHVDPGRGLDLSDNDAYGQPHTSLFLKERRFAADSEVVEQVREAIRSAQVRALAGLPEVLPGSEEDKPAEKSDFVFDSGSDVGYSQFDFKPGPPRA